MALIVSDTFTDTDGTSLDAHVPETRPGSVMWVERSGDLAITTNRVYGPGVNSSHATIDAGESDGFTITAVCYLASTNTSIARDTGVILRYTTGANYILASYNNGADVVRIVRMTSGTPTTLASQAVTLGLSEYTLVVTVDGNDFTATVNGVTVSASDSQNSTSTNHGIYMRDVSSYVSSFVLETPGGGLEEITGTLDVALDTMTLSAAGVVGSTTTYTDGYGGDVNTAKDAQISATWPALNGGAHANFQFASNQRSLIEFDLSAIPSGSTCVDATLYLYHSYEPEGGSANTISVHSISAANGAWVAGVGDIDPALEGECTWNGLASDGAGGVATAWAGSAGLATAGTDYETPAMGSFSFDGSSAIGTEYAVTLDASRVEDWFGASNTNYGMILIGAVPSGHVGQSDNPTTGYRPKLVVNYVAAVTEITGSLDITLTSSTLSAAGTPSVTGTASITSAGAAAASSGTSSVAGSLTSTLAASTIGAAGTSAVTGSLAVTLTSATLAASGSTGELEEITGSLAVTLTGATLASAGTSSISGTLAVTLTAATLAAAGYTSGLEPITGSLAVTLAGATLSAAGTSQISGTLAASGASTISAAGSPSVTGSAALATTASLAASGSPTVTGSAAFTTSSTFAAAGTTTVTGTLAVTLGGAVLVAAGITFTSTPTPTERIYVINGESRVYAIGAESRVCIIDGESRTLLIEGG